MQASLVGRRRKACWDRATLETALMQPAAGVFDREFYPDLPSKTTVLLYTLAKIDTQ
jgi:hypothetical protein